MTWFCIFHPLKCVEVLINFFKKNIDVLLCKDYLLLFTAYKVILFR